MSTVYTLQYTFQTCQSSKLERERETEREREIVIVCQAVQSWGLFNLWITTGQISANNTRFGCPAVNVMISSPNINIFCSEAESNITVERSWLTIKYMRYSWLGTCRSSSVTILIQHYFVNYLLQTAQPLDSWEYKKKCI